MSHINLELEGSPEFPLPERANLKWFLNEFSHTQSWSRYKNTVQSNTATIRAMLLFNTGKHAVFGHAWTRTATHASTSAWYLSVFSTYTLEYLCNHILSHSWFIFFWSNLFSNRRGPQPSLSGLRQNCGGSANYCLIYIYIYKLNFSHD